MDYSKKRWSILIAACFINLCVGSMYAWSVFAAPMAAHLGQLNGIHLTPADLAIVFVVGNSVGPITMITGGKINDTFGPKVVIFVGGLMFGGGMFLSGLATTVDSLIVTYGLVLGLGLGMVYGSTISTSIKFFPDKRGLVGGLTTALFGISSVVIPPIAAAITAEMGVVAAFKIIGAAFTIIVCGSAFFIHKCPDGFKPAGWTPSKTQASVQSNDKDWKEMLRSPTFYVLICLLMCGAVAGLMCIALASPLAQRMIGMSTAAATAAVSTLALFNVCGRILAGWLSDKIGRINTLTAACALSIIGLYLLYLAGIGEVTTFYVGISIIGVCFGAFMGVFPGLTADQFGVKNNSVNFGIMFSGFAVAGYTGPTIMRNVFGATHSFKDAFLIGIVFCVAGLILTYIFRIITKKSKANELAASQ
ncbi:L-lactate MFS transporter [Vibrio mangrovi]|uniref:OFA family MFS transporter n=1 Tax=Vibrio mangrovi TaxID=474394 RepID=A0A1Y6IT04_9VIBR|nr:OFA family MFS transporter [Vibrio mangrovi]MDW6003576.1 OFA family MFS transporter [Vibrio mangrovi]SMR99632.1 putative MFS-type transporter YhjX [Vibrio mangrovi]